MKCRDPRCRDGWVKLGERVKLSIFPRESMAPPLHQLGPGDLWQQCPTCEGIYQRSCMVARSINEGPTCHTIF